MYQNGIVEVLTNLAYNKGNIWMEKVKYQGTVIILLQEPTLITFGYEKIDVTLRATEVEIEEQEHILA